jgi:hypothetical protein
VLRGRSVVLGLMVVKRRLGDWLKSYVDSLYVYRVSAID